MRRRHWRRHHRHRCIFTEGAIRHTAVIPIAGDQVTNDIAVALRTPTQYAEEIKIKYACALRQLTNPDETIEVPGVGDRAPRRLASDRRSPKSSSRVMKNYSVWFRQNCDAVDLKKSVLPVSYSPVVAQRWKGPSNSRKKSSTCRFGWATHSMYRDSSMSYATRYIQPEWDCCCLETSNNPACPATSWTNNLKAAFYRE